MIDIIIPVYFYDDQIKTTLYSIAYQDNSDNLVVYIVSIYNDEKIREIVSYFSKFIKIELLVLPDCKNIVEAFDFGFKRSFNKYITLINVGDTFENCLILKSIIEKNEDNNYDVIAGLINKIDKTSYLDEYNDIMVYGKIYRRDFLISSKIVDSLKNIDDFSGFNKLCYLMSSNTVFCKLDLYYIISSNYLDINTTIKDVEIYVKNIYKAIKVAKKNKAFDFKIKSSIYNLLAFSYYKYLQFEDTKTKKMNEYVKKILKLISNEDLNSDDMVKALSDEHQKELSILEQKKWLLAKKTFLDYIEMLREGR